MSDDYVERKKQERRDWLFQGLLIAGAVGLVIAFIGAINVCTFCQQKQNVLDYEKAVEAFSKVSNQVPENIRIDEVRAMRKKLVGGFDR